MTKVDSPELRGLPQELVDWADQVTEALNFGKLQRQVLGDRPTHQGRRGEILFFQDSSGVALYFMSSDQSTTWTEILSSQF